MSTTIGHGLDVKMERTKSEAVYLLNDYIKADPILKDIWAPRKVNIFPMIADEPIGGQKSYPYIRYRTVPSQGSTFRIRVDFVTYYVGDNNYFRTGQVFERLWEICNMDDAPGMGPLPIKNRKFKIQSVMFVSGSAPNGPDQENGIIERGITFAVTYTVLEGGF